MPTITINIMSYKYGHLCAQAIESCLSQTRKPDVIRVYDDGIGDCKEVCSLYPEVEYILREYNLGIIENFNDALNRTSTDKVMFLGADNWLRPDCLEKLSTFEGDICSYYLNLVGTEVDTFRIGLPCSFDNGYWVWKPNAFHGSSLYDVELAKKAGGYSKNPKSIKSEEDAMLFSKMQAHGALTGICYSPLIYYRRHKNNFQ
jgi:glycosyltransferase involved in cell wall biosynthesis